MTMGRAARRSLVLWLLAAGLAGPAAAQDCRTETCAIEGGGYNVALPEDAAGAPMVLWLHGYGRSGGVVMGNEPLVAEVTARGYALVAADGQQASNNEREILDWGVRDGHPLARDDVAYLRAILDDAAARFGLDRDRVVVAGFSRGGSMVWDLACAAPETGLAYAAVAGGFWEPMIPDCKGPAHLYHSHGFTDTLVPFEGREVTFGGRDYHQGNIPAGLEIWRRMNGCMGSAAPLAVDNIWSKTWECETGSLKLDLLPGGHAIPPGWIDRVLDWAEAGPPGMGSAL
ncbi:MAG: polyhydroxybutyrate depolymerase [Pseudomonadota bacterium]